MENTEESRRIRQNNDDIRERHIKRQKKKRKRRLFVKAFLLLVLVGTALFVAAFLTPWFNITEIIVNGNVRLQSDAVIAQSGLYTGNNIFKAATSQARERLEEMPYVKSAAVNRKLPNKILIDIQESHEAAQLPNAGGYIVTDEDGKVLYLTSEPLEGYMQILGCEAEEFEIGKKIKVDADEKFDIIVLCIDEFEKADLIHKVNVLDVTNAVDLKFTYENRLEVFCGEAKDMSRKLLTFAEIAYNQLSPNARGEIDLRSDGQYYYRP